MTEEQREKSRAKIDQIAEKFIKACKAIDPTGERGDPLTRLRVSTPYLHDTMDLQDQSAIRADRSLLTQEKSDEKSGDAKNDELVSACIANCE